MKITVFGATGMVGSRVVREALTRGHEVTAVVRNAARGAELPPSATMGLGDATQVGEVEELMAGQDVAITATRAPRGRESELAGMTEAMLTAAARTGVRLLVVGGAATLTVPDDRARMVIDDPRFVPPEWRPTALASANQLAMCQAHADANWAYLSPPAMLEPGVRTGHYRLGRDVLLVNSDGRSWISVEDFAVALVDEAESPRHHRTRFTVAALAPAVPTLPTPEPSHRSQTAC